MVWSEVKMCNLFLQIIILEFHSKLKKGSCPHFCGTNKYNKTCISRASVFWEKKTAWLCRLQMAYSIVITQQCFSAVTQMTNLHLKRSWDLNGRDFKAAQSVGRERKWAYGQEKRAKLQSPLCTRARDIIPGLELLHNPAPFTRPLATKSSGGEKQH